MEFNQTLFIQAGIFIVIFFILKTLYFKPLLELLERRDAATTGKTEAAEQMAAEMEIIKRDYQERLYRVRSDLEKDREHQLALLRDELSNEMSRLKTQFDESAKVHTNVLERECQAARQRFPSLAQDLKKDMVDSLTNLKWGSA